MSTGQTADALAEAITAGNRRALARAITLIESTRADHREQALTLLDRLTPRAGNAVRIGISGVPGVGKSTFIEAFGLHIINEDHKLAVLSVDPSSVLSGGSILGDKTRMQELSRSAQARRPDNGLQVRQGGGEIIVDHEVIRVRVMGKLAHRLVQAMGDDLGAVLAPPLEP